MHLEMLSVLMQLTEQTSKYILIYIIFVESFQIIVLKYFFLSHYRYRMIFVPFTGIDNHKRCITFGAGLLSSESIESYKWLLNNFKTAFGKEPNVIVTDQDPALLQAVPAVFTSARHRLCMWHISQKFTEKVSKLTFKFFWIMKNLEKIFYCIIL